MKILSLPRSFYLLLLLLATVYTILAPISYACNWSDRVGNSYVGIDTGLGCIPFGSDGITKWILQAVVGIAGGLALLMLIIGGVQFVSSSGDPDAIEEARGKITSAIAGLILIIFSILIMKIIGIDVLGLPNLTPAGGGGINLP